MRAKGKGVCKRIPVLRQQSDMVGNDWDDWSNLQIVHNSTAGECLESVEFSKRRDFSVAVANLAIMRWGPLPQCPLRMAWGPKWPI